MKIKTTTMATLAMMALATTALPTMAADYVIDTKGSHASINFSIKHLGYSVVTGRFNKFNGSFSFDEKDPAVSKVSVEIDTSSVDSNHSERDKHLRSPDFLDAGKFPTAKFVSTSIKVTGDKTAMIMGKLTLHGVTKDVALAATHVGGGKDPWGGTRQGFSATTKIALADFGIKYNLGPASKEVALTLHVEGVKK